MSQFNCNICQKSFDNKYRQKYHVKSAHQDNCVVVYADGSDDYELNAKRQCFKLTNQNKFLQEPRSLLNVTKLPISSCVAVGRNIHLRKVFEHMAGVVALSPLQALVWRLRLLNPVTIEGTIMRYYNLTLYMFIVVGILYILYDNNLTIRYCRIFKRIFKRQPACSSYQTMQDKPF